MESRAHDAADQSMESSGSDIRHVEVEEQSQGVDKFDAQIGGLENVGCTSADQPHDADILIIVPGKDTRDEVKHKHPSENMKDKDEAKQPSDDAKDEAKDLTSGILDKSDSQNGDTGEIMLRMDGGSSNDERLQLHKAPQLDSASVMHGDHASSNSPESRCLGYGFETGDMVWGKVKSHPWWPGQIFNEVIASPSVWRTKKDGQVLVAFFGDSSYGWVYPAELIPYEPYFVEKSQQSTSRNFLKAVEESVDEACRRGALGLTCFCRNPRNFRPTNVPGHVAVDVFDYEPGGIYSQNQIQKARDNFKPEKTLSFIEQLAAAPQKASVDLDSAREKAVALAYRSAVFEEIDETYAQAFGQEPVRPIAVPPPSVDQSVRAHLSGQLVIAESLSVERSSTKAVKSREQSKRDRYLLKRRDEPFDMGTFQMRQGDSTSFSSSACKDRQSNAAAGDYVFQRRDQAVFHRDQQEGATPAKDDGPTSSRSMSKAVRGASKEVGDERPSINEEKAAGEGTTAAKESDPPAGKSKNAGSLKGASKRSNAEKSDLGEKKKKRRTTDSPGSSDHLQNLSSMGNFDGASRIGELRGKPIQIGARSSAESQLKGVSSSTASEQVPVVPFGTGGDTVSNENKEGELQQVLVDLKALAQDPFHGRKRNTPTIARQIFLRFRSLVFQKSLPALPAASGDAEASAVRSARASSGGAGTSHSYPPHENARSAPPLRPPNPLCKTDDPTNGGRKWLLSERHEDVAVKRAKKVSAIKSAAVSTEKSKAPELKHSSGKGKGFGVASLRIGARVEPSVKIQPLKARIELPTFLVMKYPPGTSMPSSAELKARFARFGPMDTSQMRVFYTTNMCRILFLYNEDAERAYRFALGNKSAFANVRFTLKPHSMAPDHQATDKLSRDGSRAGEDPATEHVRPTPPLMQPSPAAQLKSCLNKPAGDEGGSLNSGGVRGGWVRFNMGETKVACGTTGGCIMDARSNISSSLLEPVPASSSSLSAAMDVRNSQQKVFPKRPLQPPVVSPQYLPNVEVASRNHEQRYSHTTKLPLAASQAPRLVHPVDISQQMLILLTRCNDIVSNVKSILGYVPYHPL